MFLTKTTKFKSEIESLFQSYWIFALEYPKQIQKILLFLEKHLFKMQCKVPATIGTWAKKLDVFY